MGGQWSSETLRAAYRKGIFPWPQPAAPILWFSPDPRGVLDFQDFHVPKSLRRFARSCPWMFTVNQAFPEVMRECARQPRPGQDGTWIQPEMVPAYTELWRAGEALSFEAWEDGVLIGGLYGVLLDGLFSGESMFYLRTNASKMCLWKAVDYFVEKKHTWIDTQMVTPVVESFGGRYISREEFLRRRGI